MKIYKCYDENLNNKHREVLDKIGDINSQSRPLLLLNNSNGCLLISEITSIEFEDDKMGSIILSNKNNDFGQVGGSTDNECTNKGMTESELISKINNIYKTAKNEPYEIYMEFYSQGENKEGNSYKYIGEGFITNIIRTDSGILIFSNRDITGLNKLFE